MSPAEFCRDIEAYLCRKNDGHLIRIVGPEFAKVCGWAAQGVPLKVAYQGIDRYFERREARALGSTRRRPVRVEFCEADILDAFDAWRRAVGIGFGGRGDGEGAGDGTGAAAGGQDEADGGAGVGGDVGASSAAGTPVPAFDGAAGAGESKRKAGLHTHIDRVMARLTQRRVESGVSSALSAAIDRLLADLDALRGRAKGARQEARAALLAELRRLDGTLIDAARESLDREMWEAAAREARDDLEAFRDRMDPAAYAAALRAATERAFRGPARLPIVSADE